VLTVPALDVVLEDELPEELELEVEVEEVDFEEAE